MLMTPMTPKVIASPSAASSRMEPSDRPENTMPTPCAKATRRSMDWMESAAAARTDSSGSRQLPAASRSTSGSSMASTTREDEVPSASAAARRSAGSAEASCTRAMACVTRSRTASPGSPASTRRNSGSSASDGFSASVRAAASRSPSLPVSSVSPARAVDAARRRRLLSRTMPTAAASTSSASPVARSMTCPPRTITARPSTVPKRPSSSASTTSTADGPAVASASMAAMRAEKSDAASPSTSSGASAAWAVPAPSASSSAQRHNSVRNMTEPLENVKPPGVAASATPGVKGLQALLGLVALDERTPRLGADRLLGLPDDVELTVLAHLADQHRLVQVVVGLVHRQREAGRRLEGLAAHGLDDLVGVGGAGLLDRLLPHVDADVGGLHRVVG